MVAFGPGISCRDAEPFYYDYLYGLETDVPQVVVEHIRHCANCESEIRRLEAAIGESEAQDCHAGEDPDVAGTLGLHFAHIGEEVTCATAKSSLPMLLVPSLRIRIPTPVTVHVDHCRQCAEDLESLRDLELRPEQLARLSRLYAATVGDETHLCRRARAKTWAVACSSFDGIDPEVLDHMCVCPRCRRRVYRRREKILLSRQPGDTVSGVGLCGGISTADLFEWVVPYGRAGDDRESSPAGDETLPSHLRTCPECVEKMQALHRTIYGISERVDSGVSTVYTTGTEVVTSGERVESLYYGYPIHVEVGHRDREPAVIRLEPVIRIGKALGRRITGPQFRPAMRVALTAAAVIPLVVFLLVSTRPASGLNVRQLAADTLKNVEALHVVRYGMYETRPVEEMWIAQDARLVVVKNANSQFVYDLTKGEMTVCRRTEGTVESGPLTPEHRDIARGLAENALGFSRSDVPLKRELERTTATSAEGTGDVYELTWPGTSSGAPAPQYRLIVLMDSATGIPQEARLLRSSSGGGDSRLVNRWVYEQSTREQLNLVIQSGLAIGQD